jgi:hypothetical protein
MRFMTKTFSNDVLRRKRVDSSNLSGGKRNQYRDSPDRSSDDSSFKRMSKERNDIVSTKIGPLFYFV